MISFREFIEAVADGSIEENITWRGNDIPGSVRRQDCKHALKFLGYNYAREHALDLVSANYQIGSLALTKQMLEYWWGLRRASDRKVARVKRREVPERWEVPNERERPSLHGTDFKIERHND